MAEHSSKQPAVPSQSWYPRRPPAWQTPSFGHAQHLPAVLLVQELVASGRHTEPRGHRLLEEQLRGLAGCMPPPLLGPPHTPMVGVVIPWALANDAFQ